MSVVADLKEGTSIAEATKRITQVFRLAGIDSPDVDARALIGHALRVTRAQLLSQSDRRLDGTEIGAISDIAERRLKREPVARIIGEKEFWSLPLRVTPDVLAPRPDTETVIEAALDFVVRGGLRQEALRILDIGTGTGALLLALLNELPNATGTGTDISEAALAVARGNAERNGFSARTKFIACDIAAGVQGPFDLIVSNPPYIVHADIATLDPEVRDFDPALALDGGADGLDCYRAIATQARSLLAPGGRLIVELGAGQEPSVRALFTKNGFQVGAARNDLAGIPRALSATIGP